MQTVSSTAGKPPGTASAARAASAAHVEQVALGITKLMRHEMPTARDIAIADRKSVV